MLLQNEDCYTKYIRGFIERLLRAAQRVLEKRMRFSEPRLRITDLDCQKYCLSIFSTNGKIFCNSRQFPNLYKHRHQLENSKSQLKAHTENSIMKTIRFAGEKLRSWIWVLWHSSVTLCQNVQIWFRPKKIKRQLSKIGKFDSDFSQNLGAV